VTHQASFEAIADRLLSEPDVGEGTGFGSSPGLRVGGKIFAMLAPGGLVVKLPARRCAELVAAQIGQPFDRGQGHPLKEWVIISDTKEQDRPGLALEALTYVRPSPTSSTVSSRRG